MAALMKSAQMDSYSAQNAPPSSNTTPTGRESVALMSYARILALIECCTRRCALQQSWHNSLGHTRLFQQTVEEKELKQREEKKMKEDVKVRVGFIELL